jgi:hypothetical protein
MTEMSLASRASRITAVLCAYERETNEYFEPHEKSVLVYNLLMDLRHWCDANEIDFSRLAHVATFNGSAKAAPWNARKAGR